MSDREMGSNKVLAGCRGMHITKKYDTVCLLS